MSKVILTRDEIDRERLLHYLDFTRRLLRGFNSEDEMIRAYDRHYFGPCYEYRRYGLIGCNCGRCDYSSGNRRRGCD